MTLFLFFIAVANAATDVHTALQQSYASEAAGDYPAALDAISGVPTSGDLAYIVDLRRGWLHYLAGENNKSVAAYTRAASAQLDSVEARVGLTLPLLSERRWTEVEHTCREVLAKAPGETTCTARLAWALYSQGRHMEAEAAYAVGVARWPSNVDLRAGRGWARCKQGDTTGAQADFALVLQLSPAHGTAREGVELCR